MPEVIDHQGRSKIVVPLHVKPEHKAMPSITGHMLSHEAGTVLYGHYSMDYHLPDGDMLRLLANHNKKTVQLLLLTHDPQKLHCLPGSRPCSLVADSINKVHAYRRRSEHYKQPRSKAQMTKYRYANQCIDDLSELLKTERKLSCADYEGQEKLRRDVISIIEKYRDKNRILANNPVISEGEFGNILYDTRQEAQHYTFNRAHQVTRLDQQDFSRHPALGDLRQRPCFVWDSELHIGHHDKELENAVRAICSLYNLEPATELTNIPANRFKRFELFCKKCWKDGRNWVDYLALKTKPETHYHSSKISDGIQLTTISPYYRFQGLQQKAYSSLEELIYNFADSTQAPLWADDEKAANEMLSPLANKNWVIIKKHQQIIVRINDGRCRIDYFIHQGKYYPLPCGQDLRTLSQIAKRHLYLPEKVRLQTKAFLSKIPDSFQNFYRKIRDFIVIDLQNDFQNHVHKGHDRPRPIAEPDLLPATQPPGLISIKEILQKKGLLRTGQSLEGFIKNQIANSNLVIVQPEHPPSPVDYSNPFHRTLKIVRHLLQVFIDPNERHPIIGSLALAAYAYGAGAIIAPKALTSLLSKLHLNGLIYAIKPTQQFGHWMNHGTYSEAIGAAVSYWQGIITTGNLDRFFVEAIELVKENPAEVAIISALAMSLGYGVCEGVPALKKELGAFPYTNYLAAGAKGGAAIYDTVMHPGDDWLIGSCKWLLRNMMILLKIIVAPFVEGYHYGRKDGFKNGWHKSGKLFVQTSKEFLAAVLDLLLQIMSIPLVEVAALLIHVPFRGISNLLSKTLASLGNLKAIGQTLLNFSVRPSGQSFLSGFRPSPLYGFSSPFGHYANNIFLNAAINISMLFIKPPFELVKNLIILPAVDILSLITRITLEVVNPVSRIAAFNIGLVLFNFGKYWDNSLGLIFKSSALIISHSSNWIDRQAGSVRQILLSELQIARRYVFNWAFSTEDQTQHQTNNDINYFSSHPERVDKIATCQKTSLLGLLMTSKHHQGSVTEEKYISPHTLKSRPLFCRSSADNELNDTIELQKPISGTTIKR